MTLANSEKKSQDTSMKSKLTNFMNKKEPATEERKAFVSRSENYPDTMRMTTSAVFVVTSDPSRACTKKGYL